MEKLPENIDIYTNSVGDFGSCAILFEENDGVLTFKIVTDEEWYLCVDGKFREDADKAHAFTKDKYKDGVLVQSYPSIRHRAFEAVSYVMQGKFPKILN